MRHENCLPVVLLVAVLAAGCTDRTPVVAPPPQELTRDAVGYYCQMTVVEHSGPKGQVWLSDHDEPLWFTSVRDTLAFTRLPGEPKNIAAIYVTDMGRASWEAPEPGTWIDARTAFYVLGSDRLGGMQTPEVVPFASKDDAHQFITHHGGEITDFQSIPSASILETAE